MKLAELESIISDMDLHFAEFQAEPLPFGRICSADLLDQTYFVARALKWAFRSGVRSGAKLAMVHGQEDVEDATRVEP